MHPQRQPARARVAPAVRQCHPLPGCRVAAAACPCSGGSPMRIAVPRERLPPQPAAEQGLDEGEVGERRRRYGTNAILEARPAAWRELLRDTVQDPMIWFLVGTSVLYLVLGERHEAITLLVAILPLVGMDAFLHRRTRPPPRGCASRWPRAPRSCARTATTGCRRRGGGGRPRPRRRGRALPRRRAGGRRGGAAGGRVGADRRGLSGAQAAAARAARRTAARRRWRRRTGAWRARGCSPGRRPARRLHRPRDALRRDLPPAPRARAARARRCSPPSRSS